MLQERFERYRWAVYHHYADWPGDLPLAEECERIGEVSRHLLDAVKFYLDGQPASTYGKLDLAIRLILDDLRTLGRTQPAARFLVRMREQKNGETADDFRGFGDLFHVPFNLRHKVRAERYSIPGVPSLYLGSTTYGCWRELGSPDLAQKTVWVSSFRPRWPREFRYLDMSARPHDVGVGYMYGHPPSPEYVVAYTRCWPLIAACNIAVLHHNDAFSPEYIIPQTLLQWVRNERQFDAICFSSTRIEASTSAEVGTNWVFPSRGHGESGFCSELLSQFDVSAPVPLVLNGSFDPGWPKPDVGGHPRHYVVEGTTMLPYRFTASYRFDAYLASLLAAHQAATAGPPPR